MECNPYQILFLVGNFEGAFFFFATCHFLTRTVCLDVTLLQKTVFGAGIVAGNNVGIMSLPWHSMCALWSRYLLFKTCRNISGYSNFNIRLHSTKSRHRWYQSKLLHDIPYRYFQHLSFIQIECYRCLIASWNAALIWRYRQSSSTDLHQVATILNRLAGKRGAPRNTIA